MVNHKAKSWQFDGWEKYFKAVKTGILRLVNQGSVICRMHVEQHVNGDSRAGRAEDSGIYQQSRRNSMAVCRTAREKGM